MAQSTRKNILPCLFLILCCSYIKHVNCLPFQESHGAEGNRIERKSRDLYSEPRHTFPLDLRRTGFYNDLMERDAGRDNDDDDFSERYADDTDVFIAKRGIDNEDRFTDRDVDDFEERDDDDDDGFDQRDDDDDDDDDFDQRDDDDDVDFDQRDDDDDDLDQRDVDDDNFEDRDADYNDDIGYHSVR